MLVAGAAAGAGTSAIKSVAGHVIMSILMGSFNPDYKKIDRKKMRYIQKKYALAYSEHGVMGEDPGGIIQQIDPNSKLLMNPEGIKPANPFPDERSFEDSLQMNFHPVSGHQGRFVASHAMTCIGVIIDYQTRRRQRPWIPGLSNPGRPNDYINLFLEETKTWLRNQMTLDTIHAEELARRDLFYTKLKNDDYYWCFPPENELNNIHKVIDFVHDKVKNAYELISREEKNKSLQSLFKEMNDHTNNTFEFGKAFLAYLLFHSQKVGTNLLSSKELNGKSFQTGKLHKLLEQTTDIVFETYVQDMQNTQERLENNLLTNPHPNTSDLTTQNQIENSIGNYIIDISDYEESTFSGVLYIIEICDRKGYHWIIRKSFNDFENLHKKLLKDLNSMQQTKVGFPSKIKKILLSPFDYETICDDLQAYLRQLLNIMNECNEGIHDIVAHFIEVKYLLIPSQRKLRHAEGIPNIFMKLKEEFLSQLVNKKSSNASNRTDSHRITSSSSSTATLSNPTTTTSNEESSSSSSIMSKAMIQFRKDWGIEWITKFFDAYGYLQRMATILGWTLEINYFFISMFGNTLTFSKLPLHDILRTLQDILNKFLLICEELFQFGCKLHSDQKYKWHKNLQMAESQLGRIRYHTEKALIIINQIEMNHLDLEVQLKRLRDVHSRFVPLMTRIYGNLSIIRDELDLPTLSLPMSNLSDIEWIARYDEKKNEGLNRPPALLQLLNETVAEPKNNELIIYQKGEGLNKYTVREVENDDDGVAGLDEKGQVGGDGVSYPSEDKDTVTYSIFSRSNSKSFAGMGELKRMDKVEKEDKSIAKLVDDETPVHDSSHLKSLELADESRVCIIC